MKNQIRQAQENINHANTFGYEPSKKDVKTYHAALDFDYNSAEGKRYRTQQKNGAKK